MTAAHETAEWLMQSKYYLSTISIISDYTEVGYSSKRQRSH